MAGPHTDTAVRPCGYAHPHGAPCPTCAAIAEAPTPDYRRWPRYVGGAGDDREVPPDVWAAGAGVAAKLREPGYWDGADAKAEIGMIGIDIERSMYHPRELRVGGGSRLALRVFVADGIDDQEATATVWARLIDQAGCPTDRTRRL